MQNQAMASYGDWGGVGLAAKPNLPKLNSKYDKALAVQNSAKHNDIEPKTEQDSSLLNLLSKYHGKHKHQSMNFKVLRNELSPKLINDDKNGHLYLSMITSDNNKENESALNETQRQALDQFVKYLE